MISYYKIKAYRNYVRRDKFLRVREVSIMERIKTIATRDLTKSVKTAAGIVQEAANPDANIIFGATISDEFQDEMRVTVIATGFEMKPESFAPSAGADKTARPSKPSFVPDDIDTPVAASKQPTKPADMSDIDEIFSIFKR